ncbi:MAG: hypothetical protein JNK09_12165 [Prolixibacteraceae bacterium]|nr:hypothetical protein [Prolixibacteraceae bacterium]
MDYYQQLNLAQSKSKPQWWRMILILGFIVNLGIINVGCEKDNESNVETNDEYYVKYIAKSSSMYSLSRSAVFTLENNTNSTLTFNTSQWEMTIGPVRKGFHASLKASFNTSQILAKTYIDVEIHVCKNDDPFTLKASNISEQVRNSASTSYTIN